VLIRRKQLEAMQEGFARDFVERVVPWLIEEMPEGCAAFGGTERLVARLDGAVREAEAMRITSEPNVYRFMRVVVALGPSYAEGQLPAWVAEHAGGPRSEDARTDAVCRRAQALLGGRDA
jgi:hypothetical protein